MNKVEDIINILNSVKKGTLRFYEENGYIYCENVKTEERVVVGNVKNS